MNTNEQATWQRLENYVFDKPEYSFPFSAKLRRETGWSAAYADRAIEEYRRFAFLFAVAGHPVSPSDAVDQVWHLHLMYTEEYWKEFCGEALQKQLHHHPSKGGASESAKFEDWYALTLESYRRLFGEEPPIEFWPKENHHPKRVKIDPKTNWVISKHKIKLTLKQAGLSTGALLAVGCGQLWASSEVSGPDYLRMFGVAGLVTYAVAWAVRLFLIGSRGKTLSDAMGNVDAYETAFLRGGGVLTLNTLFGKLVTRGDVGYDSDRRVLYLRSENVVAEHPLETACVQYLRQHPSAPIAEVRGHLRKLVFSIEESLRQKGLLLTERSRYQAKAIPMGIMFLFLVPGFVRLIISANRGKPIESLTVMCLFGIILAVAFGVDVKRTMLGTRLLKRLKEDYYGWRFKTVKLSDYQPEIPMLLALYGAPIVYGTPHEAAVKYLQPNKSAGSSSSGSSCSSGCGTGCGGSTWGSSDSGSDGGGGSGGDGGGDGGGCGGCGGGGD